MKLSRLPNDAYYASLPRRRVGAGVLLANEHGWPIVVEPTYKPTWEIPGGAVEAGEDPRTCAVREVREELGIDIRLGRMLVIDHTSEPMPRGDSTMIIYDGGELLDTVSVRPQRNELRSFQFLAEEDLAKYLTPKLEFRLRCAIRAAETGTMIEIVDGQRV